MRIGLALGLTAGALLLSAPTAAADINFSGINLDIGDGTAESTAGNIAVALNGGTAKADGGAFNIAFASGPALVDKQGEGSFNIITANGEQAAAYVVDSSINWLSSVAGGQITAVGANGTINASIGKSEAKPSTISTVDTDLAVQVATCGGTVLARQGDRVNLDNGECGGSS